MSSQQIILSIITINLNNAIGLQKTLESVACQSFTDYQHIIIDGGSTDGSIEIIKQYETLYSGKPNELFWVSEPDKGIYNAMNKGIKKSNGSYLQFLNSGDYLVNKNSIDFISEITKNQECLLIGNDIIEDEFGNRKPHNHPKNLSINFLITGAFAHSATFYKREFFERYGLFDESFIIAADYDYYLKLFIEHKIEYKLINEYITIFSTGGISGNLKFETIRKFEKEKCLQRYVPKLYLDDLKFLLQNRDELNELKNSRIIHYANRIRKKINEIRKR